MDDYKIAFIYGEETPNENIYEGNIERIGDTNGKELHVNLLYEFLEEKYKIKDFEDIYYTVDPTLIIYYYYIKNYNHIVFLNLIENTTSFIKAHGYIGDLFIPEEITEKQQESLYKLLDEIEKYEITILYDFKYEDDYFDCSYLQSKDSETPRELFDKYLEIKNSKNKNTKL